MELQHEWVVPGFEDLELSTQLVIREALGRGHQVEVLDRAANFIRLTGNDKVEYLQQATRTSFDTYIAPLIMENKKLTKLILAEAGIRVPQGRDYRSLADMQKDRELWNTGQSIVVKPNSTNFGIAVAILAAPFYSDDLCQAAKAAFAEDDTVIVEEYISGKEYRFLLIDGTARAVLHRVSANVTGDGKSSIAELMEMKNRDPRRGAGYRSPLERLRKGDEEGRYLQSQGLSFSSVPDNGVTVFLRQNSNISTGGDSIDYSDTMHQGYKDIATAAAAAVGANICGVDMIIEDFNAEPTGTNYGIIELNFNPALHIHDFPHQGKNRAVERYILDALGL